MNAHRFTSIGRSVDPAYPTNRAVIWATLLVFLGSLGASLLAGRPLLPSVGAGLVRALAVFLGWALGRELDPDHDRSAFVGAALSLLAAYAMGRPGILLLVLVLVLLRIVNRTVGPAARPADSILILGLAAAALYRGAWVLGAVTALAFLLDGLLRPRHRAHQFLAAVAALVTGLYVGFSDVGAPGTSLSASETGAMTATALFLLAIHRSGRLDSVSDVGGELLDPTRVRAAQGLGLLVLWTAVVVNGPPALTQLGPLWGALAGAGLYSLVVGRRAVSAPPAR
jgi:hypothetical protein